MDLAVLVAAVAALGSQTAAFEAEATAVQLNDTGAPAPPRVVSATIEVVPTCRHNCAASLDAELVVVRPFSSGDVNKLMKSFERWSDFPPCTLPTKGQRGNARFSSGRVRADLVLNPSWSYNSDTEELPWATIDAIQGIDKWRQCFAKIFVLHGNLTTEQDVYKPKEQLSNPKWNIGPNKQFISLASWMNASGSDAGIFWLMEPDSVPITANWLHRLARAAAVSAPFSVIGSRYLGRNWAGFEQSVPTAVQHHINGNAMYNASHPVFQSFVDRLRADADASTQAHSSFDVRFAEILIHNMSVPPDRLGAAAGYKSVVEIANFAASVVVPQDIDASAAVIHGAKFMQPWPVRDAAIQPIPPWWPAVQASPTDLDVFVSDWGEGDLVGMLPRLVQSGGVAATTTRTSTTTTTRTTTTTATMLTRSAVGEVLRNLPFSSIGVITASKRAERDARERFNVSRVVSRSWERGGSEWDLCDVTGAASWFMLVDAHHTAMPNFLLSVDVADDGGVRPLAPRVAVDSDYCRCTCTRRIHDAQTVNPTYEYDHQFATSVIHAATRDAYCAEIRSQNLTPSINGYFAFVALEPRSSDMYTFLDQERYGVGSATFSSPVYPEVCPEEEGEDGDGGASTSVFKTNDVHHPEIAPLARSLQRERRQAVPPPPPGCITVGGSFSCPPTPAPTTTCSTLVQTFVVTEPGSCRAVPAPTASPTATPTAAPVTGKGKSKSKSKGKGKGQGTGSDFGCDSEAFAEEFVEELYEDFNDAPSSEWRSRFGSTEFDDVVLDFSISTSIGSGVWVHVISIEYRPESPLGFDDLAAVGVAFEGSRSFRYCDDCTVTVSVDSSDLGVNAVAPIAPSPPGKAKKNSKSKSSCTGVYEEFSSQEPGSQADSKAHVWSPVVAAVAVALVVVAGVVTMARRRKALQGGAGGSDAGTSSESSSGLQQPTSLVNLQTRTHYYPRDDAVEAASPSTAQFWSTQPTHFYPATTFDWGSAFPDV